MKRVKKFFWRFFPLVVCCCIIFSFSTYASAESYAVIDYQDFIQDVSYSGDTKMVHAAFSWQLNYIQLTQNSKNLKYEYGTKDFVCPWSLLELSPASNTYPFQVVCFPLGMRAIKLSNFPKSTTFTLTYRIEEYRGHQVSCHLYVYFQWYDKDMNYLGHDLAYDDSRSISDSKVFNINTGLAIVSAPEAKYFRIRVVMDMIGDRNQNYETFSIYPTSLYLDIPLSSLMVQEEQNQKIIDQLGDMVNGTPEQNQQVGAAVDGLENSAGKMEDLADNMKVEKPDLSGVDVSPDSIVNVEDRALLTAPLTKLWEDPTILGLITTVFTLVLVSWVFFGKKE